jgi:predicted dehydrogenase
MSAPSDLDYLPHLPSKTDYRIGVVGAGFIVRDVQLAAYRKAGFDVVAIASRTPDHARAVARQWEIPCVYATYQELLADPTIEIVDVAFPPDQQLAIVREAVRHSGHLRGILAQKPLAMTTRQAREIVTLGEAAGIPLAVNQNMRYDQAMRALKDLLRRGILGTPVVASIEMRARPHWQEFLQDYDRLTFLNMSIHHLDVFRFLFGDPARVLASARTDPRTSFPHTDGIVSYVLEYADGLRAMAWDDTFTWSDDAGIRWRVEGTAGTARGTIGWPDYPGGSPSALDYTLREAPNVWYRPRWEERWFPDAFVGTMGQLMQAIQEDREPEISGRDNLRTMALVDACYRSVAEHRAVEPREILTEEE